MTITELNQLMSRAITMHRAGRLDDAVPLYREALRRDPNLVQVHGNLGAAYSSLGRFEEATRCYQRVIRLRPGDPDGHAALGRVLQHMGQAEEALEQFSIAYLEGPDESANRLRLVDALAGHAALRVTPQLRRTLAALATDDAVRHQRLVPLVARALKRRPPIARALRRIADGGTLAPGDLGADLYRALSGPMSLRLLRDCVFSDIDCEALLTALRTVLLEGWWDGSRVAWPQEELLAAFALQALTTEWVYEETPEEVAGLLRLEQTLADPETRVEAGAPSRALQVYALYRPLDAFADDAVLRAMAQDGAGVWSELLRRHLLDPAREQALTADLPRLTPIEDDVSQRVQAQYEARPYPRWRTIERREPRPVGEVLAAVLGDPELVRTVSATSPRVLVAGCGTGRHAIATATRFAGARVLAVDVSLPSLGFAARQAEDLGVSNISLAQADILGLCDLPDRFDVVECSGVLHHMASPEAGWRILRGLLVPGGLMRIGLYSERGRTVIDAIRALIDEHRLDSTLAGIRAARAAVRALPADDPARPIVSGPDFHTISGCRDLFFPAHEDRFDLPRIAHALEDLDLEFLGFELPDARVRQLYQQRFPRDPLARDLSNWDRLEAEVPNLFAAMYAFWCRAVP